MEKQEYETKTIICITTDANNYTVKADKVSLFQRWHLP